MSTWACRFLAVTLAARYLLHVARIAALPLAEQVTYIPDDAFYYLVPARRFAQTGAWSFDGTAPTTGFHLFFAYLVAGIDTIAPGMSFASLELVLSVIGAATILATVAGVCLTLRPGWRLSFLTAALFVLGSEAFCQLTTMLMEAPYVIAAAGLFVMAMLAPPRGRRGMPLLLGYGIFGSFCRSDFILLPAGVVLAGVLLAAGRRISLQAVRPAFSVSIGAFLGIGLILLHNFYYSGRAWQASAVIKEHWAEYYPHLPRLPVAFCYMIADSLMPGLARLPLAVGCIIAVVAIFSLILVSIYALLKASRGAAGLTPGEIVTIIGIQVGFAGYLILYTVEKVGVQDWYVANAALPVTVSLAVLVWVQKEPVRLLAAAGAGLAASWAISAPAPGTWPHQQDYLTAAQRLAADPALTPVGAWNAGILSYFSGRNVINLDGLMNDDIVPYFRRDTLNEYLDARGIRYIMDFSEMLEAPDKQSRGGYSCGVLTRRLERLQFLEPPDGPIVEALYAVREKPPAYQPGNAIDFRLAGDAYAFKGCGWETPDVSGTKIEAWTQHADMLLSPSKVAEAGGSARWRLRVTGQHLAGSLTGIEINDLGLSPTAAEAADDEQILSPSFALSADAAVLKIRLDFARAYQDGDPDVPEVVSVGLEREPD